MDPVIGLDVAKGESQVQGFLAKKEPYKNSFKVLHTREWLEILIHFLMEVEQATGLRPPVVLESTGHCHPPVVQYLEERDYVVILVNLRKAKTDAIDARHLCELYYKEELDAVSIS